DVLTLLFCIYLLMPMVADPGTTASGAPVTYDEAKEEIERLQKKLATYPRKEKVEELEKRIEALQKQLLQPVSETKAIRVLKIDPRDGRLYYHDPDRLFEKNIEIKSQAEAEKLIKAHKEDAGGRDVYYLFWLPRQGKGYPTQRQLDEYKSWFKD